MEALTINIARDFSETPGSRYRTEGPHSGQQFREELLEQRFIQARDGGTTLEVEFDGTEGYATSFLEEAFGGLARAYGKDEVLRIVRFHSSSDAYLVDEVVAYIKEAEPRKP